MDYKIYSQYSITFDDVLLSPGYSTIKPKDVGTSINIGDIKLQIPIISAAAEMIGICNLISPILIEVPTSFGFIVE